MAGDRIHQLVGTGLIGGRFIDFFSIRKPVMQFSWREVRRRGGGAMVSPLVSMLLQRPRPLVVWQVVMSPLLSIKW